MQQPKPSSDPATPEPESSADQGLTSNPITAGQTWTVGWRNLPVAELIDNGARMIFEYETGWLLPLSMEKCPRFDVPKLLKNMMPTGHQLESLGINLDSMASFIDVLKMSERYLSNICIVSDRSRLASLPIDEIHGRLTDHLDESGLFNGSVKSVPVFDDRFMSKLSEMLATREMPRISGTQAKIPMYLGHDGTLSPATTMPFTHILKIPGRDDDPMKVRGALEWCGMTLARESGVETATFGLIDMAGRSLGYVVERFDISDGQDMLIAEDMCSAMGSDGTLDKVLDELDNAAKFVMKASTSRERDAEQFLRVTVANQLLENGDFHLKNISILKTVSPDLSSFTDIRIAPAYDMMSTHFTGAKQKDPSSREEMVLELNGNIDGIYSMDDFVHLGKIVGMGETQSLSVIRDVTTRMKRAARSMLDNGLPKIFESYPLQAEAVLESCRRTIQWCEELVPEVSAAPAPGRRRRAI
jgi:hypothetical protein